MAVGGSRSGQLAKGRTFVRIDPHYLRPTEVDTLLGDASKARARLGWRPRVGFEALVAVHRAGVKRLLGSSCIYPRDCPQPMQEESLLSGPLEADQPAYAIAKIAGIELCWAYNRQHGTRYPAVMPTNLYGPGDHYDLDLSLGGIRISRRPRTGWCASTGHTEPLVWSSLRTLRLRERSARIRHSSKVRWGISWAGLRDRGQGYVVFAVWTMACSYGGAIRASLCGLAYRRLSFGPVACKLGARIKSNLDVELCCPFSWSSH